MTISPFVENKNQAVRQGAIHVVCEPFRKPREAAWRPKAKFFNSLLKPPASRSSKLTPGKRGPRLDPAFPQSGHRRQAGPNRSAPHDRTGEFRTRRRHRTLSQARRRQQPPTCPKGSQRHCCFSDARQVFDRSYAHPSPVNAQAHTACFVGLGIDLRLHL